MTRELGLDKLLDDLSRRADRPVDFQLFPSYDEAAKFPTIILPGVSFGGDL